MITRIFHVFYLLIIIPRVLGDCSHDINGLYYAVVNYPYAACTACPLGTYSIKPAVNSDGSFNTNVCTNCPKGTFSRTSAASSINYCLSCAPSFFTDTTGATSCIPCPANTTSNERSSSCYPIPSPSPSPVELSNCSMRPFPTSEIVGNEYIQLDVDNEEICKSECCKDPICMGYSFFKPKLAIHRCALLNNNISYVVPSNFFVSAIKSEFLGL